MLSGGDFAGPDRSYPINDLSHARNALSRVSQNGTEDLKAAVRAHVHRKFPGLEQQPSRSAGGMVDGEVPGQQKTGRAPRGR